MEFAEELLQRVGIRMCMCVCGCLMADQAVRSHRIRSSIAVF